MSPAAEATKNPSSDLPSSSWLNNVRYVNRDIMNQITRNEDKSNQTIAALRMEIQDLKRQLTDYEHGRRLVGEDRKEPVNDMFYQNTMLQSENKNLRALMKVLQETVEHLTVKNTELLAEQAVGELVGGGDSDTGENVKNLIQGYQKKAQAFRSKLIESEEVCSLLQKQLQTYQTRTCMGSHSTAKVNALNDISCSGEETRGKNLLAEGKRDVENFKCKTKHFVIQNEQRGRGHREKVRH
ncbi:hypothetical protein MRX96_009983 [Rhipicephalus microplus]